MDPSLVLGVVRRDTVLPSGDSPLPRRRWLRPRLLALVVVYLMIACRAAAPSWSMRPAAGFVRTVGRVVVLEASDGATSSVMPLLAGMVVHLQGTHDIGTSVAIHLDDYLRQSDIGGVAVAVRSDDAVRRHFAGDSLRFTVRPISSLIRTQEYGRVVGHPLACFALDAIREHEPVPFPPANDGPIPPSPTRSFDLDRFRATLSFPMAMRRYGVEASSMFHFQYAADGYCDDIGVEGNVDAGLLRQVLIALAPFFDTPFAVKDVPEAGIMLVPIGFQFQQ